MNNNNSSITSRKIFVGGLPSNITEDEFRSYFEKFGSVNDVVIMNDSETQRPRGFGFITFASESAAQNATQKRFHELNKKTVEVKIAVPKDINHTCSSNYNNTNDNSYQNYLPWGYPPYGPEYGYYHGYESQFLPGFGFGPVGYDGGYTYDGYSAIGYGALYSCPMLAWNGPALMTVKQVLVPYGDASFYPGYVNAWSDGYMRMADGGHNGAQWLGKLNHTGTLLHTIDLADTISLGLQNVRINGAE
ncbi:RNA-binding protein 1-like [Phalaenopsis equestris]|nr:RNA-binding protein 1-like [Phalaenopsis equestris]